MPVAGEVILATDAPADSDWVTGTVDSDWNDGTTYCVCRQVGNVVEVNVRAKRTTGSGAYTVPTHGNIANETIATVDSAYAPSFPFPTLRSGAYGRTATGFVDASGNVKLAAVTGDGGDISEGEAVSLSGTYLID